MIEFIVSWLPLFWALLILWISKLKPIWRFILALVVYIIIALALSIGVPSLEVGQMINEGSGDARSLAGKISEQFITALLRAVVHIPLMALFLWFITRYGK